MSDLDAQQRQWLIDFFREDATDRLRFQQEFSVSGFKTLILINGGAVIGLLTYAGNLADKAVATHLQWAFGGYTLGLVLAVLAYLPAYYGQGQVMLHSASVAFQAMGVEEPDEETQKKRVQRSELWIGIATVLCLLSVAAFVTGSISAMRGIS
jgi:hypothetical protein